jgi:hypothetical protein
MSMAQFAMIQELKARVTILEQRVAELAKSPPPEPKRQETLTLKRNGS